MKIERWLLWLMVLLIAFHCFITMVTAPEFRVLSPSKIQELVSPLSPDQKGLVQKELMMARWSGLYAQNLADRTILIDLALLIIVRSLILKCYRRRENVA